jgi:chitodextrinase
LANATPHRRALIMAVIAIAACAFAALPNQAARGVSTPVYDIATDFHWTPTAPTVGTAVRFSASATPPAGVAIKSYDWDFGSDGTVDAHGPVATWSYPAAVNYTVTLVVVGTGKHRGRATHSITVGGAGAKQPPTASFSISPAAPVVNQPVSFTSTSTDPDGTISDQTWDLNGDGTYDNGGGATALRTFSAPGEYVIGLRVTDNDGLVSFASRALQVAAASGATGLTQSSTPPLLSPFPVVRIVGRVTRYGTLVRLLRVEAPRGSKVSVRCSGRGCPFRKSVRAIASGASPRGSAIVRFRRLERLLPPGVQIRVYVTKRGVIGKYTRLRFRRRHSPARTDRCVMPGKWTPIVCPSS